MASWLFMPSWSDKIKKKVGRYLLQRYLGQFLEEKLNLDQLNVDLYNGKGIVSDVSLSSAALNELCEDQAWSVEVISGHIGSVAVTIPWNALMTDDSNIEVTELFLCIRPRSRPTDGTSMLESMWSSMSSSMQLAQDCLEKEGDLQPNAQNTTIEGLEKFAQTIDSVLNRVKAKLFKTEIRLEYLPTNSDKGLALVIKIDTLDYQNEASEDLLKNPTEETRATSEEREQVDGQKTHYLASYATHHISMEGITFWTEEFRVSKSKKNCQEESMISSQQYYSTISQLPEIEKSFGAESNRRADTSDSETSSSDIEDDRTEIYQNKEIIFGKMSNRQEIRIKMKQSEDIPGPKVFLELQFGAINFLVSPRQLHTILKFYDTFFAEEQMQQQQSNLIAAEKQNRRQRMGEFESHNINIQKRFNAMSGTVGLNQGFWSDPIDDCNTKGSSQYTDYTREFSKADSYIANDSVFSSSSSMTNSMCSSSISTCTSKTRRRCIDTDPNADISRFCIRISSVAIILLHEEILFESSSYNYEAPLSEQSVSKLIGMAKEFFTLVDRTFINSQPKEISEINSMIDNGCKCNHLRLTLTPIIAEGEEHRNTNGNVLKLTATAARAEFKEILQDNCISLVEFYRKEPLTGLPKRPEISLTFKQTSPMLKTVSGRKLGPPKTELIFSLLQCLIELDISIYDRLNAILSPSPFETCTQRKNPATDRTQTQFNKNFEQKTEISVDAPTVSIRIRFPIPDSRPLHDPDRIPWWKQNVRPDFFLFDLVQFRLKYKLFSTLEIFANEIDIFYQESTNGSKIHIGNAKLYDKSSEGRAPGIEYPRIILEFTSDDELSNALKKSTDKGKSNYGAKGVEASIFSQKTNENSPFSSKRVCRESDTPHSKQISDEAETLIIPGDSDEMSTFCENAMKSSKVKIKISLPIISVQINSKHMYEVIYNRINNDLLMWQPNSAIITKTVPSSVLSRSSAPITTNKIHQSLLNAGMMDSIYAPINMGLCDSASNTDTETEYNEPESLYFSLNDRKRNKRPIEAKESPTLSACAFRLEIGNGVVTLFAPVRDSQNLVIPQHQGQFILRVHSAYVFSVSGYQANEKLNYVCIESKSAELYHCGLTPVPESPPPLHLVHTNIPIHLKSTLYPTPENLTMNESKGFAEREMISLAIQVKVDSELRVKKIRISAGLQNATLKHNSAAVPHTWIHQFIDIFDVVDYPIEGYTPYGVATEMHLHTWDCAIDYRPLNLPFRAIATLGYFMITSSLVTTNPGCTLRFVAEDCALCLAPYDSLQSDVKKLADNKITALPSNDLVSVLDVGLLEISLRLNEKATTISPKFDLRFSFNEVHLRTCSDSARALAQLIAYLASDGDLNQANAGQEDEKSSFSTSICSKEEAELLPFRPASAIPEVSPLQQERVNTLLSDAIQEQENIKTSESDNEKAGASDRGVEVFFFPDETLQPKVNRDEEKKELLRNACKESSELEFNFEAKSGESLAEDSSGKTVRGSESSGSINTHMEDLLNFEHSMLSKSYMPSEEEVEEALPQVKEELGEIPSKKVPLPKKMNSDTDDEFCFIAEEEKVFMTPTNEDIEVNEEPIRIVDNHFKTPGSSNLLQAPEGFPMAVLRYTLCEMTVTWHIYGGNDFPSDEQKSNCDKKDEMHVRFVNQPKMSEAYKMGVSYSKGSPTVHIGMKPVSRLPWKIRGGLQRDHDVQMEFSLSKVRFSHETYPTNTKQASRQVLLVTEFEIRDRLKVSEIKKFLYHPSPRHRSKRDSQHMIVLKALHIRPNPALINSKECCLRISALNIRLNIDQDAILFIAKFFHELRNGMSEDKESGEKQQSGLHQPPVMMVDEIPEAVQDLQARKMVSENLMLLMDEEVKGKKEPAEKVIVDEQNVPIYFREVEFGPDLHIRLDYHGKRIELSRGPVTGFLMGLGQLQCSEIRLKRIVHRKGLLGVDRLVNFLLQEWLKDIKKNQLPSLLSGVGPMYTIVQLFQGIRDLFWLPIEQYQKDGRIVRGLQLGAQSFTARTALAALEITTRLIQLLQLTAETAYDMVSPGPSVRRSRRNRRDKDKRKRLHPPQDIREGVANAYQIVKEGIGETAYNLVEVASVEHDQKGYTGAVGAVVRQIPPIVVRPIVLATQATSNVLGGVKNQLVPDARNEAREKWKDDEE